uniref:Fibronectin type-III domain-containing protein n=1 Tax=Naja naja TaxID=35670 RepID=A0A8C6XGL3_NAJNA
PRFSHVLPHFAGSEDATPPQTSLGEFSVLDVTSDSVRLHWTVPTGTFDSFLIQYKDADGQPQALPVEGGSTEVTVSNLLQETFYSEQPIPVQPSLGEFSVVDVTMDSVRLHWTVPTGRFDSFLVQYKDADGQPQALPVEGGSNEVTVTSLTPSHRYKFNLYGVFGRKRSNPLSTDATTGQFQESEWPGLFKEPIPVQPSLGEFSILDVKTDSVRLYWTVSTGTFDSFLIQYKDADGQPQLLPVEGGSREVTVTNLVPSRRYKFNLYGVSGRKRSRPLSTDATTEERNPVQPSLGEFSALDITSDSVRLHWTVPTGSFDSFVIQYKDGDGQPQALPVEGGIREVTVTNLAPSRRYKFNLYGVFGRKRSSPLSTDATTVPLVDSKKPVPIQPSLGELSVVDVTSDSVSLYWTVPTGNFDSFLVQYKDADGQPQALPVEGGSNEVTVSNLVPSRRYKFNLYGISGRKRSSPLSTDATTAHLTIIEESIPVQPSLGEFSVLDVTSDSVRLYWTVPTGRFDSFLIQYKDADGQPQALPVEGGFNEVTVSNLVPSRRYKFNLYGVFGRKRSSPLSTDTTTTARLTDSEEAIPVQPKLGEFSVLDVTSDTVRLHWTVPTGTFDSFLVQYKDADGQPQALPVEKGSKEVTVTDLAPSHRYKFNLYGISGRKRSSPLSTDATTAHIRDSGDPIPIQPSLGEFSVLNVTSDSVRLHWTVPTGTYDSFLIQYKDADGQSQVLPVEGGSNEVTVASLTPSHRYKFNLYVVSGRKRSGPLSTDATTTDSEEAIPIQPTLGELSVLDITSNSVHLYWTVPTGTFDSFLIQYKDADGQPQVLPVDGGLREVTVTNLAPSHRYKFLLYGVSGRKKIHVLSREKILPLPTKKPVSIQPNLGELSILDVTSDSVRLHWTIPTGSFDSFLIQYKDADGQLQSLPVEGGSTEVTVTKLVPSRRYEFNLYGISGGKPPLATTPPVQPSLGELSVSNITHNSALLSWMPQAIPVEGNTYQAILPNLVPARRYKFNLYGVSGRKRFGPVSVDATTDLPDPVIPPSLGELSASGITSNSVHLSWTVLTGRFDSFAIQYKDAEGQPQAIPAEGDQREKTIPNLVPSRKYKFNLYGLSGRKRMGPVSVDAVTGQPFLDWILRAATPKPSLGELSISEATSNSVLLSWTISTGSFDSFLLQYKDEEGRTQTLTYKFNLYGISGQKRIGPISSEATTGYALSFSLLAEEDEEKQPTLGELSVSETTSNSLILSWSVPTGSFDSFLIQYEDGALQSLPVDGASREKMSTVWILVGNRLFSPALIFFPLFLFFFTAPRSPSQGTEESGPPGPSPNPSLGELSVSDVTSNSARLSWNVPAETFDSFQIQYKDAENKPQMVPVDKGANTIVIYYLVPSHRYKFNLYGISGCRRFGPITASTVTGEQYLPSFQAEVSIQQVLTSSGEPVAEILSSLENRQIPPLARDFTVSVPLPRPPCHAHRTGSEKKLNSTTASKVGKMRIQIVEGNMLTL